MVQVIKLICDNYTSGWQGTAGDENTYGSFHAFHREAEFCLHTWMLRPPQGVLGYFLSLLQRPPPLQHHYQHRKIEAMLLMGLFNSIKTSCLGGKQMNDFLHSHRLQGRSTFEQESNNSLDGL